jgi:putative Holliday junction resolvase
LGDDIGVASPIKAATQAEAAARLDYIGELIRLRRIDRIALGYPYNMDGSAGFKAKEVEAFAKELERRFALPVVFVDETLTSEAAAAQMAMNRKEKRQSLLEMKKKRSSGDLDSRAACLILQDYLDRVLGLPPELPDM